MPELTGLLANKGLTAEHILELLTSLDSPEASSSSTAKPSLWSNIRNKAKSISGYSANPEVLAQQQSYYQILTEKFPAAQAAWQQLVSDFASHPTVMQNTELRSMLKEWPASSRSLLANTPIATDRLNQLNSKEKGNIITDMVQLVQEGAMVPTSLLRWGMRSAVSQGTSDQVTTLLTALGPHQDLLQAALQGDNSEQLPLIAVAGNRGDASVYNALLGHTQEDQGNTAAHYIAKGDHQTWLTQLQQQEQAATANPFMPQQPLTSLLTQTNAAGETPLSLAIAQGHNDMVERLLNLQSDEQLKPQGYKALMAAAKTRQPEMGLRLLNRFNTAADPSVVVKHKHKDKHSPYRTGLSPLALLVKQQNMDSFRLWADAMEPQ